MIEVSDEQWLILERSPDVPLHVVDGTKSCAEVLLLADDFDWIRSLLGDEPDVPRLKNPRTGIGYAVLPAGRYERFKSFFEDDPLSEAEKSALLREAGKRAGWNDPAWQNSEPS